MHYNYDARAINFQFTIVLPYDYNNIVKVSDHKCRTAITLNACSVLLLHTLPGLNDYDIIFEVYYDYEWITYHLFQDPCARIVPMCDLIAELLDNYTVKSVPDSEIKSKYPLFDPMTCNQIWFIPESKSKEAEIFIQKLYDRASIMQTVTIKAYLEDIEYNVPWILT